VLNLVQKSLLETWGRWIARTRGRGGGEARGNKGTRGIRGKACLEIDRGIGLTEGTRDFATGLINQSSAAGRFLFRIGCGGVREIGISLTYLKVGTGTLGLVGSVK
jgi:hypothetical protein